MIWSAIWFFLGAICGGTAVAIVVLYAMIAVGPPNRRWMGRPQ